MNVQEDPRNNISIESGPMDLSLFLNWSNWVTSGIGLFDAVWRLNVNNMQIYINHCLWVPPGNVF